MVFFISGRWTLITASLSLEKRALCTCPMDAEASGDSSMDSNISSGGRPNSSSMISLTFWNGNCGTLSWSFDNSLMNSIGTRSGRVDTICPNLINVGPSSSKEILIRSALVSLSTRSLRFREIICKPTSRYWSIFTTSRKSPNPYFNKTVRIWRYLFKWR